jgi:hypothetical protein
MTFYKSAKRKDRPATNRNGLKKGVITLTPIIPQT